MDKEIGGIQELQIDNLVPFNVNKAQICQNEGMDLLARGENPTPPIIVRPICDGKYEVVYGYNRIPIMRELGCVSIRADVRTDLSDDEVLKLFYESNLNQESFSVWNYIQRFNAIQYVETLIAASSHQGKRNDLSEDKIFSYNRHKLDRSSVRNTTRDRIAHRLGISTATLSKYRRIVKLRDDLMESIARLLDEGKISLEVAYRMSNLEPWEIADIVSDVDRFPNKKIDLDKLKELSTREKQPNVFRPRSRERIEALFVPRYK